MSQIVHHDPIYILVSTSGNMGKLEMLVYTVSSMPAPNACFLFQCRTCICKLFYPYSISTIKKARGNADVIEVMLNTKEFFKALETATPHILLSLCLLTPHD